MNGQYSKKNVLGQLAIVLHAHLPYVKKNEKNSLEEDWLFQAILECYIPLLQSIESSKNENPLNTKLTISLSPTLLSLLNNKNLVLNYKSKNMEITLKTETSLGLETYDVLGFNSEEELELEISKLIQVRPEFENNPN